MSGNVKALEVSQQELEKRLEALQLQQQQDSTNMQAQLDDADSRSKILQREVRSGIRRLCETLSSDVRPVDTVPV